MPSQWQWKHWYIDELHLWLSVCVSVCSFKNKRKIAQQQPPNLLDIELMVLMLRLKCQKSMSQGYLSCCWHRFASWCNCTFLARDVIYTSRAYAMMPVRLSVTFVHCGYRVRWIPDIFAFLDRWMSLLLTDNTWPGSSDGIMPGFLVEGGVWKKW